MAGWLALGGRLIMATEATCPCPEARCVDHTPMFHEHKARIGITFPAPLLPAAKTAATFNPNLCFRPRALRVVVGRPTMCIASPSGASFFAECAEDPDKEPHRARELRELQHKKRVFKCKAHACI